MVLMRPRFTQYWQVALVVFSASILAMGSSCRRKGDGQTMSSAQTAQRDNCKLVVESRLEAQNVLVLHYTFRNDTAHDVFLFNALYKEIGEGPLFDTDPNLLNVELTPRGILLSKKIIAVPPDMDVEKPMLPCSTLVKSGANRSETIRLSLPLSPWTPYIGNAAPSASSQIVQKKAWFEVGFFVSSPASKSLAQRVQTKQGEAFYFDPFPVDGQRTLEVALPVELPIRTAPPR
jgi:hypothetical protein